MKKIILIILICTASSINSKEFDTLKVYQNDTLVFDTNFSWIQRPCQKPEWQISYNLRSPKDSTYYFIYSYKGQLVEEGLYTSKYSIDAKEYSGFYNSKLYHYKDNGKLSRIYYREDGRNVKIEFYKRGKLKETKIIQS